jgi:hypothetical protein
MSASQRNEVVEIKASVFVGTSVDGFRYSLERASRCLVRFRATCGYVMS